VTHAGICNMDLEILKGYVRFRVVPAASSSEWERAFEDARSGALKVLIQMPERA